MKYLKHRKFFKALMKFSESKRTEFLLRCDDEFVEFYSLIMRRRFDRYIRKISREHIEDEPYLMMRRSLRKSTESET